MITLSSTGGGVGVGVGVGVSVSSLGVGAGDSLVGEYDCDGGAGGELYCVGDGECEGLLSDSSSGEGEDDGDGEGEDCDGYEEVAGWR